ncbi:MAG TPA: glutamate racemase [Candidatus Baltobacteraceae bacterium]|nr:glutamate racemase [Candidatus Baltobacteraceae bacterium]
MLGLFDSGLGGLTVLRRLRDAVPAADMLYYADQAHVPYGERSADDLLRLLHHNLGWLDARGVDAIVMACNTSCGVADRYGWPPVSVPVLDLIDSAAQAVERTGLLRVGVIATTATVRSGAYGRHIVRRMPTARVVEVDAPALVPLVEAGELHGDAPRRAVQAVCDLLPRDVEAVVLACTHYPLLDEHFAAVLGTGVLRIDPAIVQAERAAQLLSERGRLTGSGTLECVTTGDLDRFRENLGIMLPDLLVHVRHADAAELYDTISNASAVPET